MTKRYQVLIPCEVIRLFKGEEEFKPEHDSGTITIEVDADNAIAARRAVGKAIEKIG